MESRSVLAELLSSLCEEAINTLASGNSTMTDWADPMRCVMRKEAAKLWTGEAVSSILTSPSSSHERSSPSGHRHAPVVEIERRLRACLASSSYEVRAAATKSVDRLLEGLLTRARSDGPAAYVVTAPGGNQLLPPVASRTAQGGRQPLPPVASSIIISASSNTPSRPSGMEEVSALLPSTVSAAMMPSSSLLGSGKAVAQLASLLLTDGLTSELCSRLEIALWGHLSGGCESTVKVQGRALRALSKLQEIEELLGGVSSRLGSARSFSALAVEIKVEVGRESNRIEMSRCLFDAARGNEARAAALQCLGRAFGRSLEHACGGPNGRAAEEVDARSSEEVQLASHSLSYALGFAESFLSDVSEMSHPDQSELCRRAAVASLSASGLLKLFDADLSTNASLATAEGSMLDQCSLRCKAEKSALSSWLVVLKLLEDEDVDVRASAAALAMRSFPRRGHGTACGRMPQPSPPGGLFVEVVLKQVVELLGWAASVGAAGQGAWGALQALVVDPKEGIPALLQPEVSSPCDIGASCE